MNTRILILAALTLLLVAVVACGAPPLPAPAARTDLPAASGHEAMVAGASTSASAPLGSDAAVAVDRIGIHALEPAKPIGQPNVALDPSGVAAPIRRTEPTTIKVNLTIKEVVSEIAPGATYSFWTFDGTVPGPLIRVMEGDTVELTLINPVESSVAHNIDLHAVNGPGGGAGVTTVAPGESKTFTFKALHPGAYVYHCAYAPPYYHMAQGMYGAIVVEPKGGLPPVDREFYVMQGEWYTLGKYGDQGHQEFSNDKALAEQPEYFTLNGNVEALTKLFPLMAKKGETVRIFFGVGGPNVGSNFHIIGEIFDKVYSGSPDTAVQNEETSYVPPGSVATFEFKIDEPGKYTLVDHALYRVGKGAAGVLMAEGEWDESIYSPNAAASGH